MRKIVFQQTTILDNLASDVSWRWGQMELGLSGVSIYTVFVAFGAVIALAATVIVIALYTKGDVTAELSHRSTAFRIEAKEKPQTKAPV